MTGAETDYGIRLAGPGDLAPIMELLDEVSGWLADKGLDQWQGDTGGRRELVEMDIAGESIFVVQRQGLVVATITVDEFADTEFWHAEDDVSTALYIHRMAVARGEAGQGLGSSMLDWAGARAEAVGRQRLRFDAWRTNGALHTYYKGLGFEMLRVEVVAGRGSGALFERPAAERHRGGPVLRDLVTAHEPEVAASVSG